MRGKMTLYIDQYGNKVWAKTVAELRKQVGMGGSEVSKLYRDSKEGRTLHVGYCVGRQWFTAYAPVEIPVR